MKTSAILLVTALALLLAGAQPVAAQGAQDFPVSAEIELTDEWVRESDLARIPDEFQVIHLCSGEQKCTPGTITQLRCGTVVTAWDDAPNLTIKRLVQPCKILGDNCGFPDLELDAFNVNLKIRPGPDGAILDLFCVARKPLGFGGG